MRGGEAVASSLPRLFASNGGSLWGRRQYRLLWHCNIWGFGVLAGRSAAGQHPETPVGEAHTGRYGYIQAGVWGRPGTLWVWAPGRPQIRIFWSSYWRQGRQYDDQKRHQEGHSPSLPTLVRVGGSRRASPSGHFAECANIVCTKLMSNLEIAVKIVLCFHLTGMFDTWDESRTR